MLTLTTLLLGLLWPIQEPSQPAQKNLKATVAAALERMRHVGGYEVAYSMFEVLHSGSLGEQVKALMAPTANPADLVRDEIKNLKSATKSMGLSVQRQLEEREKSAIPAYARESGLLFGSDSMSFQIRTSLSRFMQTCLSDTAYLSVLRMADYDIIYFPEVGRLEINPPSKEFAVLCPQVYCSPLPLAEASVARLIKQNWEVRAIMPNMTEIRTCINEADRGYTVLAMGGPALQLPQYCRRQAAGGRESHALLVIFDWVTKDDRSDLSSVLHIQDSPEEYSIVLYEFTNRCSEISDRECVLAVSRPRQIIDRRGAKPRSLRVDPLPVDLLSFLDVLE